MIVTQENFAVVLKELREGGRRLAVDSETTGLRPYADSRPFSMVIASSAETSFYFNFNEMPDIPANAMLGSYHAEALGKLLSNPKNYLFLHNAKFDMAMLEKVGINLGGVVHDTMVMERLLYNDAKSLSLDNCVKRLGHSKDDAVSEYIKKHKLHTDRIFNGKEVRDLHYDKVPFELIVPYAEKDAQLTHMLGESQLQGIADIQNASRFDGPRFGSLVQNEKKLLRTVYEMERHGVMIDRAYCEKALAYERGELQKSTDEFKALTGKDFIDSAILWKEIFHDEEIKYGPETATGKINPIFDNYALEGFRSPIAKHILNYREGKKRADFYANFLYFADDHDVLHASFNQSGTATGRFSGFDPNLQQLKKEEGEDLKKEFIVRRAIIPRPGFMFLMLDYQQVEYKLMLDIAESLGLIAKVLEGLDVHQATADLAGISRKDAKTVNFAILYGAGPKKIAKSLGVTDDEAYRLKRAVLDASPEISAFIGRTIRVAKVGGLLFNWCGRRYRFSDPNLGYRGPNHIIQGGSADVMKMAMNKIGDFLKDRKSRLVLTIHDELVIELSLKEKYIVPNLKKIMESVYPGKHLALTCTTECSLHNLADKQKFGDAV